MKVLKSLFNCVFITFITLVKNVGKHQGSLVVSCYYSAQNVLLFVDTNLSYKCFKDGGTSNSILHNFSCLNQATF